MHIKCPDLTPRAVYNSAALLCKCYVKRGINRLALFTLCHIGTVAACLRLQLALHRCEGLLLRTFEQTFISLSMRESAVLYPHWTFSGVQGYTSVKCAFG